MPHHPHRPGAVGRPPDVGCNSRAGLQAGSCWQAIAKAQSVTGNAARLVRAPTLCLCKAPGEEDLAARMLPVLSSDEIRVTTATARAWEAGAASCYPRIAAEQSVILGLEMLNVERRMA
jgi:hypothetical protein